MTAATVRRASASGQRAAAVGFGQRWVSALVAVAIWELVARIADSVFFPPPSTIGLALVERWLSGPFTRLFLSELAVDNLLPSLGRVLGAWAITAVVGVVVGVALGRSGRALEYVGPLLAFARALPPPILLPVFLLLLGIGPRTQIVTIVFGAIWPVVLNAVDGARSVDATQTATARSFRIPRSQWLLGVVLPAAAPKIFAGLRVSLSLALILMVISELVGATEGLGYQLRLAQAQFDYVGIWAVVVLLGVLGYALNAALLAVERRILRWGPTKGAT